MNRRSAAAYLASLVATGCGGGGGGNDTVAVAGSGAAAPTPAVAPPPAPAPAPAPAPVPAVAPAPVAAPAPSPTAFAGPSSIALWGDSMVPGIARAFEYMWSPPRRIFDGGIAGQASPEIAARATADVDHRDWITIYWMGHNNITDPERVKADLAASIAHLAPGNDRFIVLSILNNGDGSADRGSDRYNTVLKLDSELAAAYGNNYLDIRSFMVAQSNPGNPQQAEELRRDVPSSTLRFDGIHLHGPGDEVVAQRLIDFIRGRGW
jgi:lysophospholipase L1-like esterase